MNSPKFSVIISVCNPDSDIKSAIDSVLNQTYTNYEIIAVDDIFTKYAHQTITRLSHPKIKYITCPTDNNIDKANLAGIRAAKGDYIAFIHDNVTFHPDKLIKHLAAFEKKPEADAVYNGRYEVDSEGATFALWHPPEKLKFVDLLVDIPIYTSDLVLSRNWINRVKLLAGNEHSSNGAGFDIICKLALANTHALPLNQALNYHRHPVRQNWTQLEQSAENELNSLSAIFAQPICPEKELLTQEKVLAKAYLLWSYRAFAQNETDLGQDYLRKSIRLDRSILDMQATKYLDFLVSMSVRDNTDHESILLRIFKQLPPELAWITPHCKWAIGRGYLIRAVRTIIWHYPELTQEHLVKAATFKAKIDKPFLRSLIGQITEYETEFGSEAARQVVRKLTYDLRQFGANTDTRWFSGSYFIKNAFRNFNNDRRHEALNNILRAVSFNPIYLTNRGVLTILFRSLLKLPQRVETNSANVSQTF